LAGASPEEAVDAFVDRARSTFGCLLSGTLFGSGNAREIEHSLTLYAPGQREPNIARLTTHHGGGEIIFQFAHLYSVIRLSDEPRRSQYEVSISFYQYRILDINEGEIAIYDWAPAGLSTVRTPHMHIPAAGSIILPQRAGSRFAGQKTFLDDLHFPTGYIFLEDIVELLIREFRVDSRREDWEEVVKINRQSALQAVARWHPDF
jgi:hypothetical protein